MTDTQQPPDPQQSTALMPRATSALAVPEDPLILGEYARAMLGLPEFDQWGNRHAHILAGKILTGREIGVPAMASAREIFVIKGAPTLSAKIQLALVRASPLCKTFKIFPVVREGNDLVVKAEAERSNGDKQAIILRRSQFQHLLQKDNWKQSPERMLTARAITYVVRDLFSDIVSGIETTEERLDDVVDVQYHVEPEAPKVGAAPIIEHPPAAAPPVEPIRAPEAPKPTPIGQAPETAPPAETTQPIMDAAAEAPKTPPNRKGRQTRKAPPAATPAQAADQAPTPTTPPVEAAPVETQESPPEPIAETPAAESKDQGFINFDDPVPPAQ